MKSFTGYINEMAAKAIADLDTEFLKRAQKVTSFNITSADFTKLDYKSEIQYLFNTHFFPKFDVSKTIKGKPTVDGLNKLIKALKKESTSKFNALHDYNLKGVGPGEATLFFLLDDANLGGGSAAAADIRIGGADYEVKAADLSGEGFFKNFKLGGTVPLDRMVGAALRLRDEADPNKTMGKERNGVNGTQMKAIMRDPKLRNEWNASVEKPYQEAAYKYLSKNPLILMINKTPVARRGEVLFIGKIKKEQVGIDVVSQGTIKPKIKF